jgi:hypothetical protein
MEYGHQYAGGFSMPQAFSMDELSKEMVSIPFVGSLSFIGLAIVILLLVFWTWIVAAISGGGKEGLELGNYGTGGNSPLWEAGSGSDQANLYIDPGYMNRSTIVGDSTAWTGCASMVGSPPTKTDADLFYALHG